MLMVGLVMAVAVSAQDGSEFKVRPIGRGSWTKVTNRIGFPDNECSILETRLQVKIDSRASRKE